MLIANAKPGVEDSEPVRSGPSTPDQPRADFTSPTTDIALIERVIDEVWNAGQIDLADELFAANYVNHGGLVPDLVKGPEGIKFSVV